jgi:hypothetical protein
VPQQNEREKQQDWGEDNYEPTGALFFHGKGSCLPKHWEIQFDGTAFHKVIVLLAE